ncbi:DUF4890 domain-containing protein [Belliella marina]|uniref:DUF4890 domain-containing protein n=1 Tax=Belliella marina TaxID=1644146 RepID=A0ABW4VP93_9BACT
MKKLLIMIAIFSVGIITAEAQRGPRGGEMSPEKRAEMRSPEKRAEMMADRLAEKLALSQDQKKEVYAIQLESARKNQAEMEARRAEMKAKRAEMQAKHQEQQSKIEAVLTPEQLATWKELKDADKEKRNNIRDARTNPDREKFQQRRRGGERNRGNK